MNDDATVSAAKAGPADRPDPPPPGDGRPVAPARLWTAMTGLISGVIVILDQVTKELVRQSIPLHASRTVIPGLFDLTHVENSGAAFGILNAVDFPHKAMVLATVAAIALVGIGAYAARLSIHQRLARIGLALILGGAAGNLIDRIAAGCVVDFVDVYWRGVHFWAFNVADSAITVGVIGIMLDMLNTGPARRG